MAKKQITAASSAQERNRAAEELRSAQQQLATWLERRRSDPNTPRETFEGQDFGPMITVPEINAEARRIATQFDYVDYGNSGFNSGSGSSTISNTPVISVGGDDFFVPGYGTNPNTIAPSKTTTANNSDDAAIRPAPRPVDNNPTPPSSTNPSDTGAVGSNGRFTPAPRDRDPAGSSPSANSDDSGVAANNPDQVPGGNSTQPTTPTNSNSDDSGAVGGANSGGGANNSNNTGSGGGGSDSGEANNQAPQRSPGRDDPRPDGTGTNQTKSSSNTTTPGSVDVSRFGETARRPPGGSSQEKNPKNVVVRPNVLHNYSNWTYSIGLYMLSKLQHNTIVENGKVTSSELSNLLIRSGGTGGRGLLGDKRDYHIENLKFTSVIGQNARTTKSSNNFNITFEIVEPYGVAFMAELVQAAASKGIEDHYATPYLLEIKFSGYNDEGKPFATIPGSGPKYIPIKLINITFKIDSAATIYTVTAVPFAHSPLQDKNDAYIPEGLSLSGNTFKEVIDSLIVHLNASEKSKAKLSNRAPNTYSANIIDVQLAESRTGLTLDTEYGGASVGQLDRVTFGNNGGETVQLPAGTTFKDAIQLIAQGTNFGAKYNTTGTTLSDSDNATKPFRLIKVIPAVKLGDYNIASQLYAQDIIYKIETEKQYGYLANGMPAAKAEDRGWLKEYNWIFTGKNQDIVDFSAEYNLQYFYIKSDYSEEKGKILGTPGGLVDRDRQGTSTTDPRTVGNVNAPAIRSGNAMTSSGLIANINKGAAYQQAADHMDNVLNNPQGDMVMIDLTIIGDPEWIPQDASILPYGNKGSTDSLLDSHGSIAVDTYDVLATLNFRTPRDYSESAGLMQIETEQTFVQGKYRVITVTSNFVDGKFEQQLKLIRLQNQDSNEAKKAANIIGSDPGQVGPQ